jgi:hypothetical protein
VNKELERKGHGTSEEKHGGYYNIRKEERDFFVWLQKFHYTRQAVLMRWPSVFQFNLATQLSAVEKALQKP